MADHKFKVVLMEISDGLSQEQLRKLVFLRHDVIRKRQSEMIDTGIKLFEIMSERGKLGPDNTDLLVQMLSEIQRVDLLEKLNAFVDGSPPTHQDDTENAKLNIATEVISESLGRNWRRFGRRLDLSEVKLESIAKRHPTELEETAREVLKEWRKKEGSEACAEKLIKALRACDLNLTADKLESKISCHSLEAN